MYETNRHPLCLCYQKGWKYADEEMEIARVVKKKEVRWYSLAVRRRRVRCAKALSPKGVSSGSPATLRASAGVSEFLPRATIKESPIRAQIGFIDARPDFYDGLSVGILEL